MVWSVFSSRIKKTVAVAALCFALVLTFGSVRVFAVTDVDSTASEEGVVTATSDEIIAADEVTDTEDSSAVETSDYDSSAAESVDLNIDLGSDSAAAGALGVFAMFMTGGMLVFNLLIYVYFALCLQKIAEKTGTANAWIAWIPIIQIYTFVVAAKKPAWWIILLLVPVVNIVIYVLIWMELARLLGKPSWVGILTIVPGINIIVPGYLAFINDTGAAKPADPPSQVPTPPAPEAPLQ